MATIRIPVTDERFNSKGFQRTSIACKELHRFINVEVDEFGIAIQLAPNVFMTKDTKVSEVSWHDEENFPRGGKNNTPVDIVLPDNCGIKEGDMIAVCAIPTLNTYEQVVAHAAFLGVNTYGWKEDYLKIQSICVKEGNAVIEYKGFKFNTDGRLQQRAVINKPDYVQTIEVKFGDTWSDIIGRNNGFEVLSHSFKEGFAWQFGQRFDWTNIALFDADISINAELQDGIKYYFCDFAPEVKDKYSRYI